MAGKKGFVPGGLLVYLHKQKNGKSNGSRVRCIGQVSADYVNVGSLRRFLDGHRKLISPGDGICIDRNPEWDGKGDDFVLSKDVSGYVDLNVPVVRMKDFECNADDYLDEVIAEVLAHETINAGNGGKKR